MLTEKTHHQAGVGIAALPTHFWLGLGLVAFFWVASWMHWGALGEYSFLPLWIGYVLAVDGLVVFRQSASLLTTKPAQFVMLFVISAPVWWLFEGLNEFTQNWHYLIPPDYSTLHIIIQATTNFCIVIPAIFETASLVLTFRFAQQLCSKRFAFSAAPGVFWALMFVGAGMFFLVVLAPGIAFGLIWVWLFFLLDAHNALRGRPSLLAQFARGDYRSLAALALGTLICGFFWELWNFWAFPKWYYTVPIIDFWHVFEMPLLGYIGYIPFAWELYAIYQFICGVSKIPPVSEFRF